MQESHNEGQNYVVTIGTTPTLIRAHDPDEPRLELSLYNGSGKTIFLGYDSTVDTTKGFPLFNGEKESEEKYHGNLYGIVSTGTANLVVRSK